MYSGVQWFTVVYSSVQQCTKVYSDVQWCTVVYSGVQWCTVHYVKVRGVTRSDCCSFWFSLFLLPLSEVWLFPFPVLGHHPLKNFGKLDITLQPARNNFIHGNCSSSLNMKIKVKICVCIPCQMVWEALGRLPASTETKLGAIETQGSRRTLIKLK